MPTASIPEEQLFDSAFLRKLERLELVAKKIFRGQLRGEHTTARRGRGLEFSDYRRYRPGDDFRHIDWNIYSRLDKLFLRLYTAEEDVTLHLLLDCSASMAFGEPSKFNYAQRLAAALAYIGLNNLDRVAVYAFNQTLHSSLPAIKAKHHIVTLLRFLANLNCSDKTDFAASCSQFSSRVRTPGLIILISDLLGAPESQRGLDMLRHRGHDIVVLQLLAEEEIEPPLAGALKLIDAEDNSELRVTVDAKLRNAYQQRLTNLLTNVEAYCRRRAIDYLRASTAVPFEDVVLKYLRQGSYLQ